MYTIASIQYEKSYSLGVLCEIEMYMTMYDNATEYISALLNDLYKTSVTKYEMFMNEQAAMIDEAKLSGRRRGGVLPIFQTFPVTL
jgi:Exocyst complex component Sec3